METLAKVLRVAFQGNNVIDFSLTSKEWEL